MRVKPFTDIANFVQLKTFIHLVVHINQRICEINIISHLKFTIFRNAALRLSTVRSWISDTDSILIQYLTLMTCPYLPDCLIL